MPQLKTLVLSAGKSTRIAAVSGGRPKPLIEIGGEPILGRNLRWLSSQGVRDVWINLHYRPEEIISTIGDGSSFGVVVHYVYEADILGTAGAVRNLVSEWDSTFLVMYGDNLLRLDLEHFLGFHRERGGLISIALFDRQRHPHTGIAGGRVRLSHDDRIVEFCEGVADLVSPLVNAGAYLLEPNAAMDIPEKGFCDFGKDFFPQYLKEGKPIYGYLISGYCLGIDTPESYQQALCLIENGEVELS